MENDAQRDNTQKTQNNGPRVSFNRDVHVKRIGGRTADAENTIGDPIIFNQSNFNPLRRELPENLSYEAIRREAAKVLAEAESVKCIAESNNQNDSILSDRKRRGVGKKEDEKFNSLPLRKKRSKPVVRSNSDASTKKPSISKPLIFNLFNRKSETNLDKIDSGGKDAVETSNLNNPNSNSSGSGSSNSNKRASVSRSKSDVGNLKDKKPVRRLSNSENSGEDASSSKKRVPLSPIIEVKKSAYSKKGPAPPIPPQRKPRDYINVEQLRARSKSIGDSVPPAPAKVSSTTKTGFKNIGFTNQKDLDLIPSKQPISETVKETITTLAGSQRKPHEDMHSSQLPPEKLPLTKGLTVDGMIKRLSQERFSPPPNCGGAFSYTGGATTEDIIYAQVVCNDGKYKQTVHNNLVSNTSSSRDVKELSSHAERMNSAAADCVDGSVAYRKTEFSSPDKFNGNDHRRHYSDEDEGLGRDETKFKIFKRERKLISSDDEFKNSNSDDTPITPHIRSTAPEKYKNSIEVTYRGRGDGREFYPEYNELSQRRAVLESRIKSRIGSRDLLDQLTPEREIRTHPTYNRNLLNERLDGTDYHNAQHKTIISVSPHPHKEVNYKKYTTHEFSPERQTSPTYHENKTSKYVRERTYSKNGGEGYRETYRKETEIGPDGKPHTREYRNKERINSPARQIEDIDLGYIDDVAPSHQSRVSPGKYRTTATTEVEQKNYYNKYHSRNSPDRQRSISRLVTPTSTATATANTLNRQRNQRSFDKGDSGIENDYRKDSLNNHDVEIREQQKLRQLIKVCERFLKNERKHTDDNIMMRGNSGDFVYRERSIDDGSRFDPNLDRYPKTYQHHSHQQRERLERAGVNGHARNEKKITGLEKVKQFMSSTKKKLSRSSNDINKKQNDTMQQDEEMRSRYREYRGESRDHLNPKTEDIANRRRLSTPRSSPVAKRSLSLSYKRSAKSTSGQENKNPKTGWFKSLDRLSRKKSSAKVAIDDGTSSVSKTRPLSPRNVKAAPVKNLRFFGDTDMESNASLSKGKSKYRSRQPITSSATLSRIQNKHSQSAYDLDSIAQNSSKKRSSSAERHRSSSLQNLDSNTKSKHIEQNYRSQSKNLHDISESASDNEVENEKINRSKDYERRTRSVSKTNLREPSFGKYDSDGTRYMARSRENGLDESSNLTLNRKTSELNGRSIKGEKPPPGPQKPPRSMERRRAYSRERVQDSSGTEGESSQQSQRSIVYLHATTVGDIPQPYVARKPSVSRDDLSTSTAMKKTEPMKRTMSRSISLISPWKPKHFAEGYVINYSQDDEKARKVSSLKKTPNKLPLGSSATLNRKREPKSSTLTRKRNSTEDLLFDKNSSFNSSNASYSNSALGNDRNGTLLRKNRGEQIDRTNSVSKGRRR